MAPGLAFFAMKEITLSNKMSVPALLSLLRMLSTCAQFYGMLGGSMTLMCHGNGLIVPAKRVSKMISMKGIAP